jgi:hypothetical protein
MEENFSLAPERMTEVEIENTDAEYEAGDVVCDGLTEASAKIPAAPAKRSKAGIAGLIISAVCGGLFVISLIPAIVISILIGALIPTIFYVVGAILCGVSLILCIVSIKRSKAAKIGLIIAIAFAVFNIIAAAIFGVWFILDLIGMIIILLSRL